MKISGKSLVYAHRGDSREVIENTRLAFERALESSVDGIETDIQLSRDGVPVLWHDRFLGKIGHPVRRIQDFDYRELREMELSAPGKEKTSLMSLSEFIAAYRQRSRLLLEIKNREGEDTIRQQTSVRLTLELAGEAKDHDVIMSSFHVPSLVYANQLKTSIPLVCNCDKDLSVKEAGRLLETQPFLSGLCLHKASLSQDMVDMLRSRDKLIAVYTCNSEREIRHALDVGVDILISDVAQKALQLRDA
jgi:glycerophosphoryl diester phosphodiesterase